jgi:tRNA threonylcarbamoyl adenosine modification protein YeaZ
VKILILDASQKIAILGLAENGKLLKMETLEGRSSALLPKLSTFCSLDTLDAIAVGVGPGSYMGVRTAATIAKTLSFALNLPIVEFSSPLAFLPETEEVWTVVGDAKMGELYVMEGNHRQGLSQARLVPAKDFFLPPSHVLDLRAPLSPQLDGVARATHTALIQGKTSQAKGLSLEYLR